MPRREDDEYDDDADDDVADDRDAPLASDVDDPDDDDESVPCPYCGKLVYEGAEICPHCRNFISFEDAPRRHPWWIWVGLALALSGILWWVL